MIFKVELLLLSSLLLEYLIEYRTEYPRGLSVRRGDPITVSKLSVVQP